MFEGRQDSLGGDAETADLEDFQTAVMTEFTEKSLL